MTNTLRPEPGQVWEKPGAKRTLSRRVNGVTPKGRGGYEVHYQDQGGRAGKCWCTTWENWARNATLVRS